MRTRRGCLLINGQVIKDASLSFTSWRVKKTNRVSRSDVEHSGRLVHRHFNAHVGYIRVCSLQHSQWKPTFTLGVSLSVTQRVVHAVVSAAFLRRIRDKGFRWNWASSELLSDRKFNITSVFTRCEILTGSSQKVPRKCKKRAIYQEQQIYFSIYSLF